MPVFYHPAYLKARLHSLRYNLGGLTDDPETCGLCKDWFTDPSQFEAFLRTRPEGEGSDKLVLVHLDKSKWYGPGNVKWGTWSLNRALRTDNPKLKAYYASRKLPSPKGSKPTAALYEGKTLAQWSRESGVSVYLIRQAMGLEPEASMTRIISQAHAFKANPRGKRGRPATLYEGKTLRQWAAEAGLPYHLLRSHVAGATKGRPMQEVVEQAAAVYSKRGRS